MKNTKSSLHSRPIAALFELLGQRWVLRALWELRDGALTFRALSDACGGVPSATLNARVQDLRRAGIVAQTSDGYGLTPQGRTLGALLLELNAWSKKWPQSQSWRVHDPGGDCDYSTRTSLKKASAYPDTVDLTIRRR